MTEKKRRGKIITFYSYKGGTGRSMTLANVAWILASQGQRVLTLDWDLEAPGLHRYFYPFLADKDLTSSDGIIDFVHKFTAAAAISDSRKKLEENTVTEDALPSGKESPGQDGGSPDTWYKPYANILRYATSLRWKFRDEGVLDFIPAGRQGPSYPTRINTFNWQHFYEKLGGGHLLELAKERMRSEYDYILIDSRTGVSDTSGICTIEMPDILVVCFTLNNQSIEGAAKIANDVFEKRLKSEANRRKIEGELLLHQQPKPEEAIQIFPVPMRVENAEKVKLQTRKEYAKDKFKLFPNSLPGEKREKYWGDVPVIYIPYYAYEEILAVFGDNPSDRISILAAAEHLTSYLTQGAISKTMPPAEQERRKILEEFEGGLAKSDLAAEEDRFAESIFMNLAEEDRELVRQLMTRLVRVAQPEELSGDILVRVDLNDINEPVSKILRPLINSGLIIKTMDDATGREVVQIAQVTLIKNWVRLREWLDTDREFLLWRQRLNLKIDEWKKGGRDPGALLSGVPLNEALAWVRLRVRDLNAAETDYITQSVLDTERRRNELQESRRETESLQTEYAKRRSKLQRSVYILVAVFLGLTLSFSLWSYANRAKELTTAKSLQLIALSQGAADPELSLLLALEAVRVEENTETKAALTNALQKYLQRAVLSSNARLNSASYSPDGKSIATASAGGTATIWSWDGNTWQEQKKFSQSSASLYSAAFSPDGGLLLTAGFDRNGFVYTIETERPKVELAASASILDATFSPDGAYIATATSGNEVNIWDANTGKLLAAMREHRDDVNSVAYSPDGKFIVTASADLSVRLFDANSRRLIRSWVAHEGNVYSAVFSPSGRFILTASADSTVKIWDAYGQGVATLRGHFGEVRDARYSPDESLIVTAGADATARVWDVKTGQMKFDLTGHRASVLSADFSPNGEYVVTASDDKTARIWQIAGSPVAIGSINGLVSRACETITRNMTLEEWQRYKSGESYRKTCANLP